MSEATEKRIRQLLEEKINPRLGEHLGGAQLVRYEDGVASIRLTGECAGCEMANITMEDLIRPTLKEAIPAIREVEVDSSIDEESMALIRQLLHKD